MTVSEMVRKLRLEQGLSQRQLARLSGVNSSCISLLESGKRKSVSYIVAEKLAKVLGIETQTFFTNEITYTLSPRSMEAILREAQQRYELLEVVEIPLLGSVPGGEPWTPVETPADWILIPKKLINDVRHPYAVRLNGDSLEGYGISDGETLIIDPDAPVIEGNIYIVRIGDNEVTAKKVYREDDRVRLVGSNCSFEIMEERRVEILGKVRLFGHWQEL